MDSCTKFVILAGPRTGSTYLVDYLGAVPGVRCLSEVFHSRDVFLRTHQARDKRLADLAWRDEHPLEFLELLRQDVGAADCFGFKMIANQNPNLIFELCQSREWRKIFVWRENLFEQAISIPLAAEHFKTEEWGRTPNDRRLTLQPHEVLRYVHMLQSFYMVLESSLAVADQDDVFNLRYDELGTPDKNRELLDFLGVEPAIAEQAEPMVYDPGPSLRERLENYDEISAFFRHSRYREWLR